MTVSVLVAPVISDAVEPEPVDSGALAIKIPAAVISDASRVEMLLVSDFRKSANFDEVVRAVPLTLRPLSFDTVRMLLWFRITIAL